MPKYYFTCKYCDHKWDQYIYDQSGLDKQKCDKCGDRNVKITSEKPKLDFYGDVIQKDPYIKND